MELLDKIIKIVDNNFIYCLVPIVLTLAIAKRLLKNKSLSKQALIFVKWSIIIYTSIIVIQFIINLFYSKEFIQFIDRASGPYKIAYLLMFSCATILPFTLLLKKLGTKYWYILLISFLMKIGFYFERFVIITTSIHRDSMTSSWDSKTNNLWLEVLLIQIIQGVIIASLILVITKVLKNKQLYTTQG